MLTWQELSEFRSRVTLTIIHWFIGANFLVLIVFIKFRLLSSRAFFLPTYLARYSYRVWLEYFQNFNQYDVSELKYVTRLDPPSKWAVGEARYDQQAGHVKA